MVVSKVVGWLFLILLPALASGVLAARLPKAYNSSNLEEHAISRIHPLVDEHGKNDTSVYATYRTTAGRFHGARASVYVWRLETLHAGQSSAAVIWLANFDDENRKNYVQAGWQVAPKLYNDGATHLFVGWTTDDFKTTGCFNLDCPGFVRTSKEIGPGDQLPFSIYDGQQRQITLQISKDASTGDWVLHYGGGEGPLSRIGYWPKSLFTTLANRATVIEIGGVATYQSNQIAPPMGSGHFAAEGFQRAALFHRIQIVVEDDSLVDPPVSDWLFLVSKSACYSLENFEDRGGDYGYSFYFGGPGNC